MPPTAQSKVAVLIINEASRKIIDTSQLVNQLRFDKHISATNSLLGLNFISSGYFEKFFRGQTGGITGLNLSGNAKYLVLGKKELPYYIDDGELIMATVTIDYCIISTATGTVVKTANVSASNPAFSRDRADDAATDVALIKFREVIVKLLL